MSFSPVSYYPVISVGEKLLSRSSLSLFVKSDEKKKSIALATYGVENPTHAFPSAKVTAERACARGKGGKGECPHSRE